MCPLPDTQLRTFRQLLTSTASELAPVNTTIYGYLLTSSDLYIVHLHHEVHIQLTAEALQHSLPLLHVSTQHIATHVYGNFCSEPLRLLLHPVQQQQQIFICRTKGINVTKFIGAHFNAGEYLEIMKGSILSVLLILFGTLVCVEQFQGRINSG